MSNLINTQFTDEDLDRAFIVRYEGGKYSFNVPFELKGRGISQRTEVCEDGWHKYMTTTRAFRQLYNEHKFIRLAFEKRLRYGWSGTLEQLFSDN